MDKEWWDEQWKKELKRKIEELSNKIDEKNTWVIFSGENGKLVKITPLGKITYNFEE